MLSRQLQTVGLHSIRDVQLLNTPEKFELFESLRTTGVDLGSRRRLRQRSDRSARRSSEASLFELKLRRTQDGQDDPAATKKESSGFSMETLAIVVTALLGFASYVLQCKLARLDSNPRRIQIPGWRYI